MTPTPTPPPPSEPAALRHACRLPEEFTPGECEAYVRLSESRRAFSVCLRDRSCTLYCVAQRRWATYPSLVDAARAGGYL